MKLVERDEKKIEELFESTFHHDQFTGRSGTFLAYEGLGSVYWHMVFKLILAVQETILRKGNESPTRDLINRYLGLQKEQSYNKSPDGNGAFPTAPYSHTPKGQGAKQPGRTGMVKEEILIHQAELEYTSRMDSSDLIFYYSIGTNFFTKHPNLIIGVLMEKMQQIEQKAGSLVYTVCQVPVIVQSSNLDSITVYRTDGNTQQIEGISWTG